ncbi:MAG: hypothetical protein AAF206_09565 [Bacteroidota bacterium]
MKIQRFFFTAALIAGLGLTACQQEEAVAPMQQVSEEATLSAPAIVLDYVTLDREQGQKAFDTETEMLNWVEENLPESYASVRDKMEALAREQAFIEAEGLAELPEDHPKVLAYREHLARTYGNNARLSTGSLSDNGSVITAVLIPNPAMTNATRNRADEFFALIPGTSAFCDRTWFRGRPKRICVTPIPWVFNFGTINAIYDFDFRNRTESFF